MNVQNYNNTFSSSPEICPLCGKPNHCAFVDPAGYKGGCWCDELKIPQELLDAIPTHLYGKACICKECIEKFYRQKASSLSD